MLKIKFNEMDYLVQKQNYIVLPIVQYSCQSWHAFLFPFLVANHGTQYDMLPGID